MSKEPANCRYCDCQAIVEADVVDDIYDILYTMNLCAYHWRYVQLRHARLMISIIEAKVVDGNERNLTIPSWRDYENRPYVEHIWPEKRRYTK